MRTKVFLCVSLMILTTAMNVVEVQGQELPISDKQNSGCISRARGYEVEEEPIPTIILKKEGTILSVEVQNYISNCATSDFVVKSSMSEGNDGSPFTLSISVSPVTGEEVAACMCPYNVSFTIRDLEPNSFYLDCWWYKGLVELTEGEPLVLEDVYENVTIDGMNFTLRKAFHKAMLSKSEWVGEVRIPSELSYEGQTYSVTGICEDAFTGNTALTKVFIPRTIKCMDFGEEYGFYMNPFSRCSALESIEVEEGNPVLCSVDGVLFNKEKTRLYSYPAADNRTSYTVPEGVTWIDSSAFASNQHLVSVSLPDDVTSLGASAFYDCTNLEEVNLPSGLKTLAGYMFWNCKHLKSITIPEGVTHLGNHLFNGCASLTSVTMPESVTTTDYSIFENCTSLKNVTLSPILEQINHKMFLNCSSLADIQIPGSVTSVMSNAFKGCKALKTLDLPESITRLGDYVFSGCKLESLYIRGTIDFRWTDHYWLFDGMGTETEVYVQPSQVDMFKAIYKGPVYPLPEIAYRPFVEDGKVWKVGSTTGIWDGIVKMVEYYYFDGDTIINRKTCKQMMCQRYVSPNHPDYAAMSQIPSLRCVGAWYEEDKEVYMYNEINQLRMMYDFSLDANETILIDNYPYVIGPEQ
ncbi:MAG: leucine-rich repeat domain-containing protein, partial [Prevotella sp.]|nr:leucine-rich repeat domain-containing protein [Prevotella sp.]